MRTLTHVVAGDTCLIRIPETSEDWAEFTRWMTDRSTKPLALDTETTGLGVFGHGFNIRLVQIGDEREAWVLQWARFRGLIEQCIRLHAKWIAHNFAYDAQVLDRVAGIKIEDMTGKVMDTIIMSKLIMPHRPGGHKLKPLSVEYVDADALDTADGLTAHFRRLGFTKGKRQASNGSGYKGTDGEGGTADENETGWALIDIDDELYNRYAGLDVIYTARLYAALAPLVREKLLAHLNQFELTIQGYLNIMRRRGMRVDQAYAAAQRENFLREGEMHLAVARDQYGLENLNSTKQVEQALLRSGAQLVERNKTGFKVGKEVLLPLAGLDEYWGEIEGFENPNPLAYAIAYGKRAFRFADAYLGKFLDLMDEDGYIHTNITGLEARTSRMAASDPPIQQLPAKDWKVRRALIADDGMDIISADYKQIEFRIMAELANIRKMKEAIVNGLDLHDYTAELAYGPSFTKEDRTHLKGAGFGIAYGGGAKGLAAQLGIAIPLAARIVKTYKRVYPEIGRWSNKLQRDAKAANYELRSPTGRILALDRDRIYAALNYIVQSTAADVLKNAIEALFTAGLGDHLLMPVHDEIIAQGPKESSQELANEIALVMKSEVGSMPLDSDAEVYGSSWGHGYSKPGMMGVWE